MQKIAVQTALELITPTLASWLQRVSSTSPGWLAREARTAAIEAAPIVIANLYRPRSPIDIPVKI